MVEKPLSQQAYRVMVALQNEIHDTATNQERQLKLNTKRDGRVVGFNTAKTRLHGVQPPDKHVIR